MTSEAENWLASSTSGSHHPHAAWGIGGGTPGGCISPILANVYLHYVLDMWFEETVKPQLTGSARLIRFADDFVIVLSNREAALQVTEMLYERFADYGLSVHPDNGSPDSVCRLLSTPST